MELELTIESLAYGGSGLGRRDGKVYFVPFTLPGETVRIRLLKEHKRFCEAELVSVISASVSRIAPRCSVYGKCGGCAYQHAEYSLQLSAKRAQVEDLLRRVARIEAPPVAETVPSPQAWAYRNRIRVHVQGGRVGFFEKRSADVVDVEACPIAMPEVNEALTKLRRSRPAKGQHVLSARPGVRFFEQTNDGGALELIRVVREGLRWGGGLLVDAYCGAGFFARHLAENFESVCGIELNAEAVAEAVRFGGERDRYIQGDVEQQIGRILEEEDRSRVVVLLDPPAAGLSGGVVECLGRLPVKELVYVSCDPATQARDIGLLSARGYRLTRVVPVDMFPQTADIESVAFLEGCL